ncbi:MAG: hypothetical protein KDK45_18660, partial [Leptospiraceae bacterium]|nr:hypothetical protein [Leptospiraceae bacterium]
MQFLRMKTALLVCIFLSFLFSLYSFESKALNGIPISSIRISGLYNYKESYIKNKLQSKENKPYSASILNRDLKRLYRTKRFYNIAVYSEIKEGQLSLNLICKEKPLLGRILWTVRGKDNISFPSHLKQLEGKIFKDDMVNLIKEETILALKKQEYVDTKIFAKTFFKKEKNLYFIELSIQAGKKYKFGSVKVNGLHASFEKLLSEEMQERFFRFEMFSLYRAKLAKDYLQDYFIEKGFKDVEISPPESSYKVAKAGFFTPEQISLNFRVKTGKRYFLNGLSLSYPETRKKSIHPEYNKKRIYLPDLRETYLIQKTFGKPSINLRPYRQIKDRIYFNNLRNQMIREARLLSKIEENEYIFSLEPKTIELFQTCKHPSIPKGFLSCTELRKELNLKNLQKLLQHRKRYYKQILIHKSYKLSNNEMQKLGAYHFVGFKKQEKQK